MGPSASTATVRYVFLGPRANAAVDDPNYLEFTLHSSEVTDEVYLHVVDYSALHNAAEQRELWDGLVAKLREQVGG